VEFEPGTHQQLAGLACFYNTKLWYYLHITRDEKLGRVLRVGSLDFQTYTESSAVAVPDGPLLLRADVDGAELRFTWSSDDTTWTPIGGVLDASLLSDEYATRLVADRVTDWGFTGAFVGLAAQDLTGAGLTARFGFFDYQEN
jgi:xylan 1,4-beta-xylosidase